MKMLTGYFAGASSAEDPIEITRLGHYTVLPTTHNQYRINNSF